MAQAIRREYSYTMCTLRSLLPAAFLVACAPTSRDSSPQATGIHVTFDTTSGSSSSGGTGDSSSADGTTEGPKVDLAQEGETDDGVNFDLPPPLDLPPAVLDGCTMVDFLFVIDNSGSMGDEQEALVNSFPGFIAGIQSTLEEVDSIHVGVTTTDAYRAYPPGDTCRAVPGLVSQTTDMFDPWSSGEPPLQCGPFVDGGNYMTEADGLASDFTCAASVGIAGDPNEQQLPALLGAINPNSSLADPGACNEGFIRFDALLVVVLITDEPDSSEWTALDAYDFVVDTKAGYAEAIVMVSVIQGVHDTCPGTGQDGAKLSAFTDGFIHGMRGDICAEDYSVIFNDAADIVIAACEEYSPPPPG